jgi:hypothetical protein
MTDREILKRAIIICCEQGHSATADVIRLMVCGMPLDPPPVDAVEVRIAVAIGGGKKVSVIDDDEDDSNDVLLSRARDCLLEYCDTVLAQAVVVASIPLTTVPVVGGTV